MVRDTSIEAYNSIKSDGSLGRRQLEVYEYLYNNGPLTANKIFKGTKGVSGITQANIHARLNELRQFGVVKEVGKTICDITGKKVYIFDVTSNHPQKTKRELTKDQKINRLKRAVRFCLNDYKDNGQKTKYDTVMRILKGDIN